MGVQCNTAGRAAAASAYKAPIQQAIQKIRDQINGLDPKENQKRDEYNTLLRQKQAQLNDPFQVFPNRIPGVDPKPTPQAKRF